MQIPTIDAGQLGTEAPALLDRQIGEAASACGFLILTNLPDFTPSELADQITAIYALIIKQMCRINC